MDTIILHCAVIEWGEAYDDAEPALVVARTQEGMFSQLRDEIEDMANTIADPEWRNVIAAADESLPFWEWFEGFEDLNARPYVTAYTKEV